MIMIWFERYTYIYNVIDDDNDSYMENQCKYNISDTKIYENYWLQFTWDNMPFKLWLFIKIYIYKYTLSALFQ